MDPQNQPSGASQPARRPIIRIILAIVLFVGAMFCSYNAVAASIQLGHVRNQNSDEASELNESQKNWGIGASALVVSGLIVGFLRPHAKKPRG